MAKTPAHRAKHSQERLWQIFLANTKNLSEHDLKRGIMECDGTPDTDSGVDYHLVYDYDTDPPRWYWHTTGTTYVRLF